MSMEATNIITVSQLGIGYGGNPLIEPISLSLNQGELCGIIGGNGIGKSTLLRTLAGLQTKCGGAITLQGKALESFSLHELAQRLAVVLTDPLASKNLRVQDLVALGRQPYSDWLGRLTEKDREIAQDCMALLDLQALQDRRCAELSDGQLQRVLIARAMAQDTPLILLDEPTSHLDLYHKVSILKRLRELAHVHGKTILFTSHEVNLALELCDKLLILDGKDNPFGAVPELLASESLATLFPDDSLRFDPKTKRFILNR